MSASLRRESYSNSSLGKSNNTSTEGGHGAEGTPEEASTSTESSEVKRRQKKDRERRFSAPPGGRRQTGDRDSIGSYLSESQGVKRSLYCAASFWHTHITTPTLSHLCIICMSVSTAHPHIHHHSHHPHTFTTTFTSPHIHHHAYIVYVHLPHTCAHILLTLCLVFHTLSQPWVSPKVDSDDEESVQSEVCSPFKIYYDRV